MSGGLFQYSAFGLILRSTERLPMLPVAATAATPDIVVRDLPIPDIPDQAMPVKQHAWVAGGQTWLRLPNGDRFWIANGSEIGIEPAQGQRTADWYFNLLGVAMMCLLTQRGLLPLHGCAFVHDGAARLVLGRSGAGKSTLAVWLDRNGYRVLGDDLCVLKVNRHGDIRVLPAYPQAKLAPSPLVSASSNIAQVGRRNKSFVALRENPCQKSVPLAAVYLLEPGNALGIQPLNPLQAVQGLALHTQRKTLFRAQVGEAKHWQLCGEVARQVPVFSFSRTTDIGDFDRNVNCLREHFSHGL